jgi:hypothetical protein
MDAQGIAVIILGEAARAIATPSVRAKRVAERGDIQIRLLRPGKP